MNFGAELNTSGSVAMYHFVGITPEAPTLAAAFGGRDPKLRVEITQDDLERVREKICGKPGKIDFAMFGCPHLSVRQVGDIARVAEERNSRWACGS